MPDGQLPINPGVGPPTGINIDGNVITPGATATPTTGQALRQTVAIGDPSTAANKAVVDASGRLRALQADGDLVTLGTLADAIAAAGVAGSAMTYLRTIRDWADRIQNQSTGTLLTSASRTANTTTPQVNSRGARGVIIYFEITVVSAGGLSFQMQFVDPQSGLTAGYGPIIPAAKLLSTGRFVLVYYPSAVTAGGGLAAVTNSPVPGLWSGLVVHGDANPQTYSVSYGLLQ